MSFLALLRRLEVNVALHGLVGTEAVSEDE